MKERTIDDVQRALRVAFKTSYPEVKRELWRLQKEEKRRQKRIRMHEFSGLTG